MPTVLCGPLAYDSSFPGLKNAMDPKEHFYRHFEARATSLQEDIANLGNISTTGGERKDATDHVLSGISRLTNEVSDASEFAPPRDQKIYNEALKALREQLTIQTSRLNPPGRFSFSPTSREVFLASLSSATRYSKFPDVDVKTSRSNSAPTAATAAHPENRDNLSPLPTIRNAPSSRNYNAEMASRPDLTTHRPSFSTARDIDIRGHTNMHILLPATAARATTAGRVAELRSCVLDMSVPTTSYNNKENDAEPDKGRLPHPFASLTINDVQGSLVVAGHVNGPAHITGVRDSVLVINARQVRMHECVNVRVFLWCGSRPIIEGCTGVRFAQIPAKYLTDGQDPTTNQWDQVDDFNWLKTEASPNWRTLTANDDGKGLGWIAPQFWDKTVLGGPTLSTNDILRAASIPVV